MGLPHLLRSDLPAEKKCQLELVQNERLTYHSDLMNFKPVLFAGEILIRGGKVIGITNSSGHYQPSLQQLINCLETFDSLGLDLSDVQISDYNGLYFTQSAAEILNRYHDLQIHKTNASAMSLT